MMLPRSMAHTTRESMQQIASAGPDVVLLDSMTARRGDTVRLISATSSKSHVIAFAVREEEAEVLACAQAGVAGYIACDASSAELAAILRVMAKRQNFVLPDDLESSLDPWMKVGMRNKSWGQAREMRTLLERAREAQATRIAHDPTGDLRKLALNGFYPGNGSLCLSQLHRVF